MEFQEKLTYHEQQVLNTIIDLIEREEDNGLLAACGLSSKAFISALSFLGPESTYFVDEVICSGLFEEVEHHVVYAFSALLLEFSDRPEFAGKEEAYASLQDKVGFFLSSLLLEPSVT